MKTKTIAVLILTVFVLSACNNDQEPMTETSADKQATESKEKKILYWVAPMDPNYRRDEPGKSPMGMDLIPVYEEGDDGDAVKISPSVVQNLGVRTSKVKYGRLWRRIDTVGYVGYDEDRISHIHLRTDGWIEKLNVKSEGELVKKGDVLFLLYSPTLANAQEEFIQALRIGNANLRNASRDRLLALGISSDQIDELSKTRVAQRLLKFYAPQDGVITELRVREGMYIKPATEIMMLADLSSVWVMAEVFESQADWVKKDQSAEVYLKYLPSMQMEGVVDYVYPSLNPKTRTLKVRLRFENAGNTLKPNMYADVTIYGGAKKDLLYIPREALIRTGQKSRVILDAGGGKYEARDVEVGIESGDSVEITAGLHEGENVVTSGQFLIDSEASLKASLKRMTSSQQMQSKDDHRIVTAHGVIKKLKPQEDKVNLSHDPIDALGWPAMTMDFDLSSQASLEGLKEGDSVMFELMEVPEGFLIKRIWTMDGSMEMSEPKIVSGRGMIKKLMPQDGKVNLSHDPISELGWPAMTMDFSLGSDASLEGLKEGDAVMFELSEVDGSYVVKRIWKMEGAH